MEYGKVFRQLRKDKNMTIAVTAYGITSISMLSKFERGISELTVSKFVKLLERIDVTLNEFEIILNDFEMRSIDSLIESLTENYTNRNFDGVEKIVSNQLKIWKKSKNQHHKYNYIMLSIMSDELKNLKNTKQEDIDSLTDYLFSVEKWTYYEIILFGNSMSAMQINTVVTLSKELLKRTKFFHRNKSHRRRIIQVILNSVITCLVKGDIENSVNFQDEVDFLIDSETYLYEKTILLYYEGLTLMKKGEVPEGENKAMDALKILKKLQSNKLVNSYVTYWIELFGNFDYI